METLEYVAALALETARDLGVNPERLEAELRKGDVAAFVVEPVQGKGVNLPAPGYLREAEKRPNLTVLTHTLVDRVELDGHRALHDAAENQHRIVGAQAGQCQRADGHRHPQGPQHGRGQPHPSRM